MAVTTQKPKVRPGKAKGYPKSKGYTAKKVFSIGNTILLGAIGGGGLGSLLSITGAILGGIIGILATGIPELNKLQREEGCS